MGVFRREVWSSFICGSVALAVLLTPGRTDAEEPREWLKAERRLEALVDVYKAFHQAPELSLHEEQTAARLAAELKQAGATVTTGVGGHGVVGILKNGDGPTLLLRTDLDALPVVEETGLPYASTVRVKNDAGVEVGAMHACGHDIHIATQIGVARYLAAHRDQWRGTLMFIGQPAEEFGLGAQNLLQAGLFKNFPRPDFGLALHVDSNLEAGKIGYRAGYVLANVDSVDIIVRGKGGHGAQPHTTVDPIVQAAHLIVDLQSIVSREIPPLEPAVITVGSIHGGTKHNIIGNTCHLQLTVRSFSDKVRKQLLDGIRRKALAAAASAGAPEPTITLSDGTPALFNDEPLVTRVIPALSLALGDEHVVPAEQSMGGEDFSEYGRAGVPIFMFRLGAVEAARLAAFTEKGEQPPSLHSSRFYPDPAPTLETGVTAMVAAVRELLPPKP